MTDLSKNNIIVIKNNINVSNIFENEWIPIHQENTFNDSKFEKWQHSLTFTVKVKNWFSAIGFNYIPKIKQCCNHNNIAIIEIYFQSENDAVLFKITWL